MIKIKKTLYTMKYYSAIKKNKMSFVMDELVIMSEVSQTEKEKYCMTSLIRGI